MKTALADPIEARLASDLRALFRGRVQRVILFGSRARADAHAASDYDVLVVLDAPTRNDNDRLIDWIVGLHRDDIWVDAHLAAPEGLTEPSLFMEGIRQEGRDIL